MNRCCMNQFNYCIESIILNSVSGWHVATFTCIAWDSGWLSFSEEKLMGRLLSHLGIIAKKAWLLFVVSTKRGHHPTVSVDEIESSITSIIVIAWDKAWLSFLMEKLMGFLLSHFKIIVRKAWPSFVFSTKQGHHPAVSVDEIQTSITSNYGM